MSEPINKVYSCFVIDDEGFGCKVLEKHLEKVPQINLIGSFSSPVKALNTIQSGAKPDIIFLDVEMPQMSGIDLIESLPKESAIILITGHSKYAVNGFDKDVVDFLLKPISFDRFTKAINKAKAFLQQALRLERSLFINLTGGTDLLPIKMNSILCVEAQDHNVSICTMDGNHHVKISIKHIMDKLPNEMFIRVHRSFIVNMNHIKSINRNFILLTGGIKISIGEAYKAVLFELIQQNK